MSDLSERFKNLTPQQQKLLKMKLQKRSGEREDASAAGKDTPVKKRKMDFGIFFFSADGTGDNAAKYDLLTDTARFADEKGFTSIWTPERHFQAFGGLYPTPAVTNSALAVMTKNIRLRAMVDNLSDGRVDIAFATGWHKHDYVIQPLNYHDRRDLMFEYIDIVSRLWRGETVEIPGVDKEPTMVKTFPRPVQDELPFWITATSSRTFEDAGRIGANVLTMMATNFEDVQSNIKLYREARTNNGHDPRKGIVTVMLHTYLDHDIERARDKTRDSLTKYLENFLDQMKYDPAAAPFMDDQEKLLSFAFERYFATDALLGPPDKCARLVDKLADAGANEIACLVDFGPSKDDVLASLEILADLRVQYSS